MINIGNDLPSILGACERTGGIDVHGRSIIAWLSDHLTTYKSCAAMVFDCTNADSVSSRDLVVSLCKCNPVIENFNFTVIWSNTMWQPFNRTGIQKYHNSPMGITKTYVPHVLNKVGTIRLARCAFLLLIDASSRKRLSWGRPPNR